MEDALGRMAAAVRKYRGIDTELPKLVPVGPSPVKGPPRMTLGGLFALAGFGGPRSERRPGDWLHWLQRGQTTPAVRQPAVRADGVIEAPVPRRIARALRSRG